jgi:hypothetical protein
MNYSLAILGSGSGGDHKEWIKACESSDYDIEYKVIDLFASDWLDAVLEEDYDCYLARPPVSVELLKRIYDERLFLINKVLGRSIYPSYGELLIYENKEMLAYWLAAHSIPHPHTWIFHDKPEALGFTAECDLPVVAKTTIGASGSGVRIIRDRAVLREYIEKVFSNDGVMRKWGPNLRRGDLLKRFFSRIRDPWGSYKYFRGKYEASAMSPQKGFAILQEYVECDAEWRCVRIGDSYFAHKKLKGRGEMFSGTSMVSWERPPEGLLNFVKEVCDTGDFLSQAVDLFEQKGGKYLVNELQCFFGSKNPHQMIVDGKPGRYVLVDGQWVFEDGNFNGNNSFDLRLKHVIDLLDRRTL